jgi:hypothetical protein
MSPIIKIEEPCSAARRIVKAGVMACLLSSIFWVKGARSEEEARSADTAAARELAIEGLKLADAGQCAQAIDKLARAEKLHHAPIVLGRLGECEIADGKIVDGTEDLRRLLREPVANNPPPALLKARERAQRELDIAKPKIAQLTISVTEPTSDVTVTIDGQLVPPALFDRGRPTDPREHVIEVSAKGYLKSTRQVTLGPGEKQEVVFKLLVDPQTLAGTTDARISDHQHAAKPHAASVPPEQSGMTTVSGGTESPPTSPSYAPSYILWSIGGAAAAVGGVFGYVALKDKRELDKQCVNNACPSTVQAQLDSARQEAMVSTVLVGSGAAVAAVGTVIYLLTGPSHEKSPSAATLTTQPVVGLGQVGVRGTF